MIRNKKLNFLSLRLLLVIIAIPTLFYSQNSFIRLGWDPNTEPDLFQYRIYRDLQPGTLVFLDSLSKLDSTYTDESVVNGETYYYKLTSVDYSGNESGPSNEVMATAGFITLVDDSKNNIITDFELKQNYPNPFNPNTTIEYNIPRPGNVSITIYNLTGQEIRKWAVKYYEAGNHKIMWDGKDDRGQLVPSGIYFYQMIAGDYKQVRRAVLQK